MAKLRRNYVSSAGKSAVLVRVAVFAALLAAVAGAVPRCMPSGVIGPVTEAVLTPFDRSEEKQVLDSGMGADTCVLFSFNWCSICYAPKRGEVDQVAYLLARHRLSGPGANPSVESLELLPRVDVRYKGGWGTVLQVPLLPTHQVQFRWDGYMEAWNRHLSIPQEEAFYWNMWRPLEEQEKKWAGYYKKLYVQAGPIWYSSKGQEQRCLPDAYYKAILDLSEPGWKGIGFMLPHSRQSGTYQDYAITIDSLESSIGKNLFRGLMSPELEKEVESHLDKKAWLP